MVCATVVSTLRLKSWPTLLLVDAGHSAVLKLLHVFIASRLEEEAEDSAIRLWRALLACQRAEDLHELR